MKEIEEMKHGIDYLNWNEMGIDQLKSLLLFAFLLAAVQHYKFLAAWSE